MESFLALLIHLLLMFKIMSSGFGAWISAKVCFLSWFAEAAVEMVTLVEVAHKERVSMTPVGVGSIMSPPIVLYITVFRCEENPNLRFKAEGYRQ